MIKLPIRTRTRSKAIKPHVFTDADYDVIGLFYACGYRNSQPGWTRQETFDYALANDHELMAYAAVEPGPNAVQDACLRSFVQGWIDASKDRAGRAE